MSECALGSTKEGRSYCSQPVAIKVMEKLIAPKIRKVCTIGKNKDQHESCVIEHVKQTLNVSSESSIYQNESFVNIMAQEAPEVDVKELLNDTFNPYGPSNSIDPLSSKHERAIMLRFRDHTSFGKDFYPFRYQLLDFGEFKNNEIVKFDWIKAFQDGKRTFACLVNTATTDEIKSRTSGGKHWFVLYFDFRALTDHDVHRLSSNKHTSRFTKACTIEFFNSSGNKPKEPIEKFMKKSHAYFLSLGINIWCINASVKRHQYKDTCCGIFSLYYVMQRLQGVGYSEFIGRRVTDEDMFQLRSSLFRHDYRPRSQK